MVHHMCMFKFRGCHPGSFSKPEVAFQDSYNMNVQSQASQFHIYTQAVKSPLSRADIDCMRMHLRSVALNILLSSQIHSSIPPAMPCSVAMLKFYANSNHTYWQMCGLCTSSKLIPLEMHAAGIWASSDSL